MLSRVSPKYHNCKPLPKIDIVMNLPYFPLFRMGVVFHTYADHPEVETKFQTHILEAKCFVCTKLRWE